MKRLLLQILLFIMPFVGVALIYVVFDPFKLIYSYDNYYEEDDRFININKDYATVQNYLNKYELQKYNTYIFGNSRANVFGHKYMETKMPGSKIYCFDAVEESLYGIGAKIRFLDSMNVPIKDVLIILDSFALAQTTNSNSHLTIKHYALNGYTRFDYHLLFFKAYLNPVFIAALADFKCFKTFRQYMENYIIADTDVYSYNPTHNSFNYENLEQVIKKDEEQWYAERKNVFLGRSDVLQTNGVVIRDAQLAILRDMQKVFTRHNTRCKIVINPLYDQKKMNTQDALTLNNIFGPDVVYDFSGINDITEDFRNYYEVSHYRPHVARAILDSIYGSAVNQNN
jgi:hypothetical protein